MKNEFTETALLRTHLFVLADPSLVENFEGGAMYIEANGGVPETGYVPNNPLFGLPLDSPHQVSQRISVCVQFASCIVLFPNPVNPNEWKSVKGQLKTVEKISSRSAFRPASIAKVHPQFHSPVEQQTARISIAEAVLTTTIFSGNRQVTSLVFN